MKFGDRYSNKPIRDEQAVALQGEIERLTPEPRYVGPASGGDNPHQKISHINWYLHGNSDVQDVVTVTRDFVSDPASPDGEQPTTFEDWGVKLSPRRGERVGDFIIARSTSINMKRRDLSDAHMQRHLRVEQGKAIMRRAGIKVPKAAFEREMDENPSMLWLRTPGTLQVTGSTEQVLYDENGHFVPSPMIQTWLDALDAYKNADSSAFPKLNHAEREGMRSNALEGRSAVVPTRKMAANVLELLSKLDPADRLTKTPFV